MKKLDTSEIKKWPNNVFLGATQITDEGSLDVFSKQEREEFEGFSNLKRKAEYLSARHLFRFLIQEMNISEEKVQLHKENSGKPFAKYEGQKISVSFSHSTHKVFCAVSLEYALGLDVELVDRVVNDKVVKRILNKEERKTLGEVEPVCLWTIKESVVKCMGTGLRTNLNDLTILKEEKNSFRVRFNNDNLFEICSFRQSDHQIALAYQSKHI